MGYPTDVRQADAGLQRGNDGRWANSGSLLAASEEDDVCEITEKAGCLLAARLMSQNPKVALKITLDGVVVNYSWRETPEYFYDAYGCCIEGGIMILKRYDTVNDRYIFELAKPLDFGDSMKVSVHNGDGSAQRCFCNANWIANT